MAHIKHGLHMGKPKLDKTIYTSLAIEVNQHTAKINNKSLYALQIHSLFLTDTLYPTHNLANPQNERRRGDNEQPSLPIEGFGTEYGSTKLYN